MARSNLFSSYRQGENRVTSSMMAVFERLDLAKLERILALAMGESTLEFVRFENQVMSDRGASTPDARIAADFQLWFEIKTARDALRETQLRQHLAHLGDGSGLEQLIAVTPDIDEPAVVREIDDPRLV